MIEEEEEVLEEEEVALDDLELLFTPTPCPTRAAPNKGRAVAMKGRRPVASKKGKKGAGKKVPPVAEKTPAQQAATARQSQLRKARRVGLNLFKALNGDVDDRDEAFRTIRLPDTDSHVRVYLLRNMHHVLSDFRRASLNILLRELEGSA